MIRVFRPFCHASLAASVLRIASRVGGLCLVCPECKGILLTDDPGAAKMSEHVPALPTERPAVVAA